MNLTERQAVPTDQQWLWTLYTDLLKPAISTQWGWDERLQKEMFATHLPAEDFRIITVDGNRVAAYLINKEATRHYLKMLLVTDDYQKRGIGTEIIEKLKSNAKKGNKPLRLSVIKANPVLGFYKATGFVVCGEDKDRTMLVYNDVTSNNIA